MHRTSLRRRLISGSDTVTGDFGAQENEVFNNFNLFQSDVDILRQLRQKPRQPLEIIKINR